MKRLIFLFCILPILIFPVSALDYTAPEAPEDALELMDSESSDFASDLWIIISRGIQTLQPKLAGAMELCAAIFAVAMLLSLLKNLPGNTGKTVELAGVAVVTAFMLGQTQSMVSLASETVTELSEYGKLLLPVMTAAMAAQGSVTASAALYTATAVFDAVLSSGISKLLVPMVYIFLILSVAASATGESMLSRLRDLMKWLVTWCLKTVLYIFTGYITITGVINGTTDAAALKAAKLTMSGMIPVVGGILSDASEAVLVSAGVMKNAVGVYGLLALIAIWIAPFLQIGAQYLLLKLTAALCQIFDIKAVNEVIQAFSTAMGLLLGMIGSVCVMLLISVVCFMKGVT